MTRPPNIRRRFIRVSGGGFIAAALLSSAGCSNPFRVPASALQAWQGPAEDLEIRRWALAWAILAPNPHNRQPWLVELESSDVVSLRIDHTRLLPHTDPFARQILIGTGAFIELLGMAAMQRGYRLETEYFPQGEMSSAGYPAGDVDVARIRFVRDIDVTAETLFAFVPKRHTERGPYDSERPIPADFGQNLQARLGDLPVSAGMVIRSGERNKQWSQLASIAQDAWALELRTPRTMMESMALLRIGAGEINLMRDGISITDPMLVMLDKTGLFDRTALPDPHGSVVRGQIEQFDRNMTTTAAFFWLRTVSNTRRMQLASGAAFLRAQLLACSHAMVVHPMSQALQEYPEMQTLRAKIHATLNDEPGVKGQTVQMFCRLGFSADPSELSGPSPRRGLQAHLENTPPQRGP